MEAHVDNKSKFNEYNLGRELVERYMTFKLAGEVYGLEILRIREVSV